VFDFDLVEEELADFGFAYRFGGAHEEGGKAARVEEVIALGGGAEVPQAEIFSPAIVETAPAGTSW
jgi:hypothetical protein